MLATWLLVAWTAFVWIGRIRNAVEGDEGTGPVLLATSFLLLAGVVAATRGRDRRAVVALAAWTTGVWVVRGVDIAVLSDRSAAFVAVHLVLAAISIGLSAWAWRSTPVQHELGVANRA